MRASRLVSILMLLQTRGRVSARTLAEHLEVSARTVYRDIDELSAAGVPVIVERGAAGGFELLDGWRTTLTGLTPHEAQSLFVSGLPGPAMELGLGDTMASAQLKLLAALPGEWQAEAHRVSARFHVDLAGWYRRVAPAQYLRMLADAVWADRRITIGYESWEAVVERVLEPLGLVIKAGEWYLVARPVRGSERGGEPTPRTYRVANIRTLTLGDSFRRPTAFDLSAFWAESTRRFERELNRSTARVRITARGRTLLRGVSAAVEEAIDAAVAAAATAAGAASAAAGAASSGAGAASSGAGAASSGAGAASAAASAVSAAASAVSASMAAGVVSRGARAASRGARAASRGARAASPGARAASPGAGAASSGAGAASSGAGGAAAAGGAGAGAASASGPTSTTGAAKDSRHGGEGWLEVTIPIESIDHATGLLLGLGLDVEVIEPAALRDQIRDTARAVSARYARRRPAPASDAVVPPDARRRIRGHKAT